MYFVVRFAKCCWLYIELMVSSAEIWNSSRSNLWFMAVVSFCPQPASRKTAIRRRAAILMGSVREPDGDDGGRVGHLAEHAEIDVRDRIACLVIARIERDIRRPAEAACGSHRLDVVSTREQAADRDPEIGEGRVVGRAAERLLLDG